MMRKFSNLFETIHTTCALLLSVVLMATSVCGQSEKWNPQTTDWNANPALTVGDWGFHRPGFPRGLYLHGVTTRSGDRVTNPVILDNDDFDAVFSDELAFSLASQQEMNLVGLIVTPVRKEGTGFYHPEWIAAARASHSRAVSSGMSADRIPDVTVGTEAENEQAGEQQISAGARLYVQAINQQYSKDPSRPVIVNLGCQPATLASAWKVDPQIADKCIVYWSDLNGVNGEYHWATEIVTSHFRVISWGPDHSWIDKACQSQWRVLPRPAGCEGSQNPADSGEWQQLSSRKRPLFDHLLQQFQNHTDYASGPNKKDGYLDGPFLHAWIPNLFGGVEPREIRGHEVLHVTQFNPENEDAAKQFADQHLMNPEAWQSSQASFFRGLNLNGPPVVIDGHAWEGQESRQYECKDRAFENQNVALVPATDPERAKMIRSSRWGGNDLTLTDIPNGRYTVYLYVWEDNNSETYRIAVNNRDVIARYVSGDEGHWDKLGPWLVTVRDHQIRISSQGGAANFSGIEVWRGEHDTAAELSTAQIEFFEKRIRPLLVTKCYECHSAESKDVQGHLLVDSRVTLRNGGDGGPAVVPGNVDQSLLIKAVRYQTPELQMPPDEKLSDEEIADLESWVRQGAPDPRSKVTRITRKALNLDEARKFWSYQPLARSTLPTVQEMASVRNEIDRFILANLEHRGLQQLPLAHKRTLIRRATFDLTGLPPTPEEIEAFLADTSDRAFEVVIDRLLDSPHYGERWGRHWLDVVRYSDSAGDNSDFPIPQMYLYRNWVIDAFNRDLPYDQFIREQIAGDLLASSNRDERNQRLIATGYLANARRFGSRVDDYPFHLTIEDTIDNLGKTFLGQTINCARCHDHKFDPITIDDYYGLYGFFSSTRYPWPGIELEQKQRDLVPLVPDELAEAAFAAHRSRQTELDEQLRQLEKQEKEAGPADKERLKKDVARVRKLAAKHAKTLPDIPFAYAVAEGNRIDDVPVQYKGNPEKTGDVVPRRFPTILGEYTLSENDQTSGRLALANWIADPQNPLTARVMVNRIWLYHFGQGLVPTPNDFGKQGKRPTHPQLLDWLATRFIESGWSIKSMHRLLMLSHVYQIESADDAVAIPGDPANELLSGFRRIRLDAETIRDTLLMLGGNLDDRQGGPHPFPPSGDWAFTQHNPFKAIYESNQRSVYLMTQRIQRHPFLSIFDGPDTSTSTPLRLTSTTPLQSLFFMNSPFIHQQAEFFARRLLTQRPDDRSRIDLAYQYLIGRHPDDQEIASGITFLGTAERLLSESGVPEHQLSSTAWQSYVRSLFLLNEFVYVD